MKVCLISLSVPTPYNIGTASALPFHLAKNRPDNIELVIYSFNINQISDKDIEIYSKQLNAKINIIPLPLWYTALFKLHLFALRVFLKYPFFAYLNINKSIRKEINQIYPQRIWIYEEELSNIARKYPDIPTVITTPDCASMYYYRELAQRRNIGKRLSMFKYYTMYKKYIRMEMAFPSVNVRYHLVGKEDCEFLRNVNPKIDATFINHPHYDYSEKKIIKFSQPKIKLLVAGRYDFYMKDKCDELFEAMINVSAELKDHYMITFLGKDWDEWKDKLTTAGYEVNHVLFAPNYMEELIKHDIQITPIGVGTGTKGKVLDAFANGLMVMGTLRALENIQVIPGESCILYDKLDEAIVALRNIAANPQKYEEMAEKGRRAVLMHHGREHVAQQFFNLFK